MSAAVVLLLLSMLAACGSTTKRRTAGPGGEVASEVESIGGRSGDDDAGGLSGDRGTPGGSRSSGGASARDVAASGAGSDPARPPTAGDGAARGVTSTQIRVGFATQKDADQAAGGFGLNAAFGDQERQARAIVDDINTRGGVLGRKLALVFHDERAASDISNPDATAAAQCADWTQDRPVFAGINIVGARSVNSLFACMAKARTPLLISDLVVHSIHQLSTYAPYLYAPGVATVERWAPLWIERLNARGYFRPWDAARGTSGNAPVKVGVPYEDSDEGRRYLSIVKRALGKAGRKADDSFAFSPRADEALRQIPQMLLRFRSNNVTHVLLPASAYLITPVAERQNYRPRYGMTTIDGLSSLTVTTSPREQLRGTLAIGWLPVSDVDAAHDPGPVSPNQTRCKQVLEREGIDTSDRLTFTTQLIVCDLFYFLEAALEKAGSVSAATLQRGAAALGSRFASAMTFAERYGPDRYDGAAVVRDVRFDDACGCFVFMDRVDRPLPS